MLREASAEFGRLAAIAETLEGRDPCPPGSPLGDALAAIRWHDRVEADLDALISRLGLAAALAPAPGG
jgi:hypothetical protein